VGNESKKLPWLTVHGDNGLHIVDMPYVTPVIFPSLRSETLQKVGGLDAGAEDYKTLCVAAPRSDRFD